MNREVATSNEGFNDAQIGFAKGIENILGRESGSNLNIKTIQNMARSAELGEIGTTEEEIRKNIEKILGRKIYTASEIEVLKVIKAVLDDEDSTLDVELTQKLAGKHELEIGTTEEEIKRVVDYILEKVTKIEEKP